MTMKIEDADDVIDRMATEVIELTSRLPAKIENDPQFAAASELWKAFANKEKEYQTAYDLKKKPVRELLNTLQLEFNGKVKPLLEAKDKLKAALTRYQIEREEKARLAQQKAIEQHEKRVERAIEKGKDPEAVAPPKQVAIPSSTVATEAGQVAFRTIKKYRIVNPDLVPNEYWMLDEAKIGKVIRAGGVIPGVESYDEKTLASR
jgi:hypothetical protein